MRFVLLSTGDPVYDTFPNGGGIQHQILGLATEIAKQGHEVHVICRAVEESELPESGVTFHPVDINPKKGILSRLTFSRKAVGLIDSINPDVVSAFERFSAYFPSLHSYPMSFTAENYDAFRYYRTFAINYNPINILVHPWKRRLEEGIMRRSRLVVALTHSIADYLRSVGIHHVNVIPNGVFSREYANYGDRRYVLYAGRLDAPKRVDLLIRAYWELKEFRDEYPLKVVGRGPHKNSLIKLVQDLGLSGCVEFKHWLPKTELRTYLGRCTVFVLPSDYETFGISLLEAMACSKPVVASDIPGPREIVDESVNGLLFERGNASDLAAKLRACLQNPPERERMGTMARRKVEDFYDFAVIGRKTSEALSHLT